MGSVFESAIRIPTSCLPILLIFIPTLCWFFGHTHWTYMLADFSSHFSQQLLIAEIWYLVTLFIYVPPYCGKRFWTHRNSGISYYFTLLIFIHIEHICSFFVAFLSATIDCRNLIFGHNLHIGTPYRGKRFWIHQIPTSCLPILLIFIHI